MVVTPQAISCPVPGGPGLCSSHGSSLKPDHHEAGSGRSQKRFSNAAPPDRKVTSVSGSTIVFCRGCASSTGPDFEKLLATGLDRGAMRRSCGLPDARSRCSPASAAAASYCPAPWSLHFIRARQGVLTAILSYFSRHGFASLPIDPSVGSIYI